jgi:hypothetical protein
MGRHCSALPRCLCSCLGSSAWGGAHALQFLVRPLASWGDLYAARVIALRCQPQTWTTHRYATLT